MWYGSTDIFVNREDIVHLDEVMNLNFDLIGLKVITSDGKKIGKIVDYTGTKIKKIKKATIAKVSQSKETKNIVIITTNGKKYGLYIAK